MTPTAWKYLESQARAVLQSTLRELPQEIRDVAVLVPCLFEPFSLEDPDLLGLYCEFTPGELSPANGPIILYLQTIEEYCRDEGGDFKDEVRQTYLHELGHHFGWDEGDLEERGLE